MKSPFLPQKSAKEVYKEEYEASKKGGESFFPETMARDAVVVLLVVGVIVTLSILFRAGIEPPADPTSTTYNPRPEWYFLFFFQFLKLFPGWLEPVAAAVIPLLALIILVLIPLLDRNLERRISRRKKMLSLGLIFIVVFATLEITGWLAAPSIPEGEESLQVQQGRDIYREINCGYCHSIGGVGSNIGPDLSNVGRDLSKEQITAYLENPHAMVPESLHPKLLFTSEEKEALAEYLATLGAQYQYSERAPELYAQNCSSCHMLNGEGGTIAPNLTNIGDRRSINFLESFTSDPKSVLPGTTMPAFKEKLSAEQIKDIAAYLYSQQSEVTPSETLQPPIVQEPPVIPHNIEGRENCLSCHGESGTKPYPTDHAGRTNDTCTICHQQSK